MAHSQSEAEREHFGWADGLRGLAALAILSYEALELPGDGGQRILVYTAEPDSPSQEALNLLASWSATPDHAPVEEVREEH